MRKGSIGDLVAQKGTELLPSIPFFEVHEEEVVGTIMEMILHLLVVAPISLQIKFFIAMGRASPIVDPFPHSGAGLTEMIADTTEPTLFIPPGEDELASRITLVDLLVKQGPGIVLEGIVTLHPLPYRVHLPTHQRLRKIPLHLPEPVSQDLQSFP
jgi:hypothetical protein